MCYFSAKSNSWSTYVSVCVSTATRETFSSVWPLKNIHPSIHPSTACSYKVGSWLVKCSKMERQKEAELDRHSAAEQRKGEKTPQQKTTSNNYHRRLLTLFTPLFQSVNCNVISRIKTIAKMPLVKERMERKATSSFPTLLIHLIAWIIPLL